MDHNSHADVAVPACIFGPFCNAFPNEPTCHIYTRIWRPHKHHTVTLARRRARHVVIGPLCILLFPMMYRGLAEWNASAR